VSINQEKKRRLRKTLLKYQTVCCWCGKPMQTDDPNRWDYASIEHLQPSSHGGKTTMGNLSLAHRRCNSNRRSERRTPQFHRQVTEG